MTLSIKFDPANPIWDNHRIRLLHFLLINGNPDPDPSLTENSTNTGSPTDVEVRVTNIGPNPVSDVRVEAYVCDPGPVTTPGLPPAGNRVPGTGRFVGFRSGVLAVNDTQPIRCIVESSATPNTVTVNPGPNQFLAWSPSDAQHGHHCMMAHTWLDDGSEGAALSDSDPFDINKDHDAQRNIQVVQVAHDPDVGSSVRFDFVVRNPRPDPEVRLTLNEQRGRLPQIERGLLRTGPFSTVNLGSSRFDTVGLGLATQLIAGDQPFGLGGIAERPVGVGTLPIGVGTPVGVGRLPIQTVGGVRRPINGGGDNGIDVQLGPDGRNARLRIKQTQSAPMSIVAQFNPGDKINTYHTYDVVQNTPDGRLMGGMRLVAVLVAK